MKKLNPLQQVILFIAVDLLIITGLSFVMWYWWGQLHSTVTAMAIFVVCMVLEIRSLIKQILKLRWILKK